MAYVSSFVYCDSIQQQVTPQGLQTQIVSPLQLLMPVNIPGNYSFAISCVLTDFDAGDFNKVELDFVSPKNQRSKVVDLSVPSGFKEDKENTVPSIQCNVDVRNFVFEEEGLYKTEISFNGVKIGEYPIKVVKKQEV